MMMYHDQAKNSKVCRAFAEIGDNSNLLMGKNLNIILSILHLNLKK